MAMKPKLKICDMKNLNLKIGEGKEVCKNEVLEVLSKGFPYCIEDFEIDFGVKHPLMENISFYIEKIGRKRSIMKINGHPDGGVRAEKGIFKVIAIYDFIHPTNNNMTKRGVEQEWEIYI